jgi:hypothetical protein
MTQTFKSEVDKNILFEFLEKNCGKNEKYYIFNSTSYKRGELNHTNSDFLEEIKPFYHNAKRFYLERKLTYARLCTIIRQICKHQSIIFTTKVVYDKSKYNIPYFIYF